MPPSAPTSAEKLRSCFEVEQISPWGSDWSHPEPLRGPAWILTPTRDCGCLIPCAALLETLITVGPHCTRGGCSLSCLPTSSATASHFPLSIPTALPTFKVTSDRTVSPTGPLPVLQQLHGLACGEPRHVPVSFYKRPHWPWPLTCFLIFTFLFGHAGS